MTQKWNVGDPCFVVRVQTNPNAVSFGILPATVVQVFDAQGMRARAVAFTKWMAGPDSFEGEPFKTEEEARFWLSDYTARIRNAAASAPLFGERPEWRLPDNAPKQGEVVYTLDLKRRELLEVTVGIVRLEHGRMEVGYDEAPGNPEASNVRMRQWWVTRADAEAYVRDNIGVEFAFVSKEELARRIKGEIDQIWADAQARLQDPTFLSGLGITAAEMVGQE